MIKSQAIMEVSVCVSLTCSTPDAAYEGKDDSAICCASLHYILTSNKVCITCQPHCAGIESKLMEGLAPALQVLHTTWQSKDNTGTNRCFKMLTGAQKYVQDSKYRLKRSSHPKHILMLCAISVDVPIYNDWQKIIRKLSFLLKFLLI